MVPAAEQGSIDHVFAHAPNAGATPVSSRFAVSAPAGSEPRSKIANNGATGGGGESNMRTAPVAMTDAVIPMTCLPCPHLPEVNRGTSRGAEPHDPLLYSQYQTF